MSDRGENTDGRVPVYRAYEISEDDRVVSSEVIDARSDETALRKAHEIARGRLMEVWDRGRLVARIARDGVALTPPA